MFIADAQAFDKDGQKIARELLDTFGGYSGLAADFPWDRGDTNRALILMCIQIADAVEKTQPGLAESLRAEAVKIGATAKQPGSPRGEIDVRKLIAELGALWKQLPAGERDQIKRSGELLAEFGSSLDSIRVLFVHSSPADCDALRVTGELRAIKEALKLGGSGERIDIDDLPAATIHDFRRALLNKSYDIIHFSGHADADFLVFDDGKGSSEPVKVARVAELIGRYPSVKCVVLNACSSVQSLTTPISACTIGMVCLCRR